ncbi:MAG: hypothetical protein AAGM04_13970, partial [Pseudomonadota bacterium]
LHASSHAMDGVMATEKAPENLRVETIAVGTSAEAINRLIARAAAGTVLEFAAGTHSLSAPLLIKRDAITLRGSQHAKTKLQFVDPTRDFIAVQGTTSRHLIRLKADATAGDRSIEVDGAGAIKPGQMIALKQPNSRAFIAENGWTNVTWTEAKNRPFRESLHRVVAIEGATLSLATPLPFAYQAGTATAHVATPRTKITLADLTITTDLGPADPNIFSNTLPAASRHSALRLRWSDGVALKRLTFKDMPSTAVALQSALASNLETIHIDGAHNKGGLGNGYGLELKEAFDTVAKDLTILGMRHAVIFSAWHAEIGNHIHVSRTDRDINFHGSLDHGNTVLVDEIILAYAADRSRKRRRNVWPVLSPGGTNHARTAFLTDNTVRIKRGVGSWRDDVLIGDPKGAELAGGFGNDVFVVHGPTTLLDFEAQDLLHLPGTRRALRWIENGADTLLMVQNGPTVRFKDRALSNIDPSRIVFEKADPRLNLGS